MSGYLKEGDMGIRHIRIGSKVSDSKQEFQASNLQYETTCKGHQVMNASYRVDTITTVLLQAFMAHPISK